MIYGDVPFAARCLRTRFDATVLSRAASSGPDGRRKDAGVPCAGLTANARYGHRGGRHGGRRGPPVGGYPGAHDGASEAGGDRVQETRGGERPAVPDLRGDGGAGGRLRLRRIPRVG